MEPCCIAHEKPCRFERYRHFVSGLACPLLSGFIFVLVFSIHYKNVPDHLYKNRDDGIITLSHAKGLVEYGSISINPSGERIEGFSAPLQFLLFSFLYAAFRIPYDSYTFLQTYLSIFMIGVIFFLLLNDRKPINLFFSLVSAWVLKYDFSFLGWHGSGMENPITHLFFLWAICCLWVSIRDDKVSYWSFVPILLASISRIESIYHIAPILAAHVLLWRFRNKNWKPLRLVIMVLVAWAALFMLRFSYFGSLFPNTQKAQGISLLHQFAQAISLSRDYYHHVRVMGTLIFRNHFGLFLLLTSPFIYFIRHDKKLVSLVVLLLLPILTALSIPAVFGPPRIDITRTSTQMALLVITLSAVVFSNTSFGKFRHPIGGIAPFLLLALLGAATAVKPYYLGWDIDHFLQLRNELLQISNREQLHRPTVANIDLGVISWHKDFNIIDLGNLGNPVTAQFTSSREYQDYIFEFAKPDILELHSVWSDRYAFLFMDPRFDKTYQPVRSTVDEFLNHAADKNKNPEYKAHVRTGIWIRKDMMLNSQSNERCFMEALKRDCSLRTVNRELETCLKNAATNRGVDNNYITRNLYRYLPEFSATGDYDALVLLLSGYAGKLDLNTSMITARKNPRWVLDFIGYTNRHQGITLTAETDRLGGGTNVK